ncbi:MAG: 4Fe-4S binding protein [Actinomycetota bacterium]|nr:4Fe-4S binding protein [Actinomycetota bacterium]
MLMRWVEGLGCGLARDDGLGIDGSPVRPGRIDRVLDAVVFKPEFMYHFWPSVRFRPERCDSCGACQSKCPVGRLDDLLRIDNDIMCLYCSSAFAPARRARSTRPCAWLNRLSDYSARCRECARGTPPGFMLEVPGKEKPVFRLSVIATSESYTGGR